VNIKKILVAVLASATLFSISGCSMIEKTPEAIANSAVAIVNGEKITRAELDKDPNTLQVIQQAKQQYGDNYSQNEEAVSAIKSQKEQILDNMITEKVLSQKAKELNILPSDSKVKSDAKAQIDKMKKQYFGGDETKFAEALKQQGFTEQALTEMYVAQIRNQEIQENIAKSLTKNLKITDKQVKDYYDKNKDKFTEQPTKMHLEHILVKTEDEAKKVKKRLDSGESFAKVAKEVSQDTSNKDKGGDLGEISVDDTNYDAQFMAGAKALKEGQISNPVQSSFGWHIIKCIKKTEYPVKEFSKVKSQIKSQLENDQKTKIMSQKTSEWKKAAKIEKKEKNLM
jgi:foldase protein PrsA